MLSESKIYSDYNYLFPLLQREKWQKKIFISLTPASILESFVSINGIIILWY